MVRLYAVLLLSACIDNNLHKADDAEEPIGTDTELQVTESETDTEEVVPEDCNGIDDDGDGLTDEGYDDSDGDGVADCVDDECDADIEDSGFVEVDTGCVGGEFDIDDPWSVAEEWAWSSGSSAIPALIANLTDTDGDGDVDTDDIPNVVVVSFTGSNYTSGQLTVLEGDSGTVVWTASSIYGVGGHAVADADGDGSPDIAAFNTAGKPVLIDADGNTIWTSSGTIAQSTFPQAFIADLDGDGNAEVIADNLILDGATGAVEASMSLGSVTYTMAAIGDIDLDGEQEIVYGNRVYDSSGAVEWTASLTGTYGHWSAIIDADGDAYGEVAMVGNGTLHIYDEDGTLLSSATAGSTAASPPCAADFDGDGETELGWASYDNFFVFELDGTQVWRNTVNDRSGVSGCSGYDVDGDGAYEVLYADESQMYIFDGATGSTNWSTTDHASGTLFEYPTVADVDNDGSAEIVYVSNAISGGSIMGVHVIGHDGDGWAEAGPTWPIFDFAVSNVNQDATLPSGIPTYWTDYNVYRARPIVDQVSANLDVAFVDVCAAGCLDVSTVEVTVRVENTGGTDLNAGIEVALYALDGTTETLLGVEQTPADLPSGVHTATLSFTFGLGEYGADGLLVRVDDDGTGSGSITECVEDDNTDYWTDSPC